jgi:hypothetical protein
MRTARWTAALAAILAVPGLCVGAPDTPVPAGAQEKLPSVDYVLDRYVRVTGGRDALLSHKSMTVRGRYQEPAAKLDVETVSYTKDGKALQFALLPTGKSSSGYDGHTAWHINPHGEVSISEGDEVRSIARDADMYYHLHVMQYFRGMEVMDVRLFNGRTCYHLKGVNNWGRLNEQFYDTETGLLVGYAFNTAWRGGHGDATATFEDYKDFGGVLMPVKTTTRDGDSLSVFVITSVTYDDVSDSVFELPEAVRAKLAG